MTMNWSLLCECGNRKEQRFVEGCERCRALDGVSKGPGAVIAAIRVLGGSATIDQLREETGNTYRNLIRGLRQLQKDGRVFRRCLDGDEKKEVEWCLKTGLSVPNPVRGREEFRLMAINLLSKPKRSKDARGRWTKNPERGKVV